ncbi:MAG TPA: Shedu immune nuclease family protein [Terracidiphilus sp.]|nr:Shedu immune nuclease family protein [Terracidiphilus sp.]
MEKMKIESTSRHSANCSDIAVREGEQVRLLFRPEIVDNPTNPSASVRGRFVYQRKGKNDRWGDFDKLLLSSLKKGEGYQLSLGASELYKLLREVVALYRFHRREGVPVGKIELLKIDPTLSESLPVAETDLLEFLSAHSGDAAQALRTVLQWFARQPSAQKLISEGAELPELNSLIGLANLRSALKSWRDNAGNRDEGFWQTLLARHSYVLSQLFAYPVVLIKGKAYVGGKDLCNVGGNIVDFLFRTESSGAAVLVEIKTPQTPLLGPKYRDGAYPPSTDLGGAMSQVLEYSESMASEFRALTRADNSFTAAGPRSVVIIGDASRELADEPKKRSFERFRERLVGVRIVTFDEVFRRIEGLVSLLESGS